MEEEQERKVDRKVFSFFLIAFPTILIVAIGLLSDSMWWTQILLAIYQLIMLKQFMDNYYDIF